MLNSVAPIIGSAIGYQPTFNSLTVSEIGSSITDKPIKLVCMCIKHRVQKKCLAGSLYHGDVYSQEKDAYLGSLCGGRGHQVRDM